MSERISGVKISLRIKEEIKKKVFLIDKNINFSIIYVGEDSVIDNFINYKKRFGDDVGINVIVHKFDKNINQDILISNIKNISKKSDAVIVQLPLPKHLDKEKILDIIPPEKDIDVLSKKSINKFILGENLIFPPVTGAIIEILKLKKFNLLNSNNLIVGYGNLVGKPFSYWLRRENIKYNIININTDEKNKSKYLKDADLIVSGAGIPNLIKPEMIKDGVALIDCGTSESGKKVIGDIDKKCYDKSLFYTPVPGGIGPLTIAILYKNIIKMQEIIK